MQGMAACYREGGARFCSPEVGLLNGHGMVCDNILMAPVLETKLMVAEAIFCAGIYLLDGRAIV